MYPLIPRSIGLIGVIIVLAAAGGAAAQSVNIVAEQTQQQALDIRGGDTADTNIEVTFQADGFFCFDETDVAVETTLEPADGVSGTVDPSDLTFTLPTGIHDSGLEQDPYEASETVTVTLEAPSGTENDFSTQITFDASFDGADPAECGPGAFPSASDIAPISVNVQADAEPVDDEDAPGNGNGASNGDDDENGVPVPAMIVPAALALAVAIRRRA